MNPEVRDWFAFAVVGFLLLAGVWLAGVVSRRFGE